MGAPATTQPASAAAATSTPADDLDTAVATSTPAKKPLAVPKTATATTTEPAPHGTQVKRVENAYSMPPLSFELINDLSRAALVNIYCTTKGTGALRPISGSGIIIDPKGIILTNAHVAQYVLLARSERVNLSCVVRSGAPARALWVADVLFMPPAWVEAHAGDIKKDKPVGTGEHDYALLAITAAADGTTLPLTFPFVPFDAREAVGFSGDSVMVASYPAEFLGANATYNLYPATSISHIGHLFTLAQSSVDVLSVGGVLEAQSGSSGGAIVNAWGRLIALISTTSEGATTADRDLRGITLSYIDRDLAAQSGYTLAELLDVNPTAEAGVFSRELAPHLIDLLIAAINK